MPLETRTYTRDELYAKVWARPVRDVAKEFGVSDVALAKACRKLNVPLPGRGYWARKQAGHNVSPTPLPKLKPGQPTEYKTSWYQAPPAEEVEVPEWDRLAPLPEVPEPKLEVSPDLESPHPVVAASLRELRKQKPDWQGFVDCKEAGTVNLIVSPAHVDRSLRFMDALIRALEAAGHKFVPRSRGQPAHAVVDGEALPVWLREGQRLVPHEPKPNELFPKKHDQVPSGILRVNVTWNRGWSDDKEWRETPHKPLEKRVGQVFAGIVLAAADRKRHLARRQAQEQHRAEVARKGHEVEQERRKDQEDLAQLLKLARQWTDADLVRRFLARLRDEAEVRAARGEFKPNDDTGKWFERMDRLASTLDPIPGLFPARAGRKE